MSWRRDHTTMTTPGILFGFLISSMVGLIFHFIRGGSFTRLLLHVFTSWIAFFVGHFVGEWTNWQFLRYGTLNLFPALLATIVGLIATTILGGPEKQKSRKRR